MIKLKSLITENVNTSIPDITIDYIDRQLQNKWMNDRQKRNIELLVDFYHKDEKGKKWVESYIQLLNQTKNKVIKIIDNLKVPHVDISYILDYFFGTYEFKTNEEEFFPFPLYISASPQDKATIGILVDMNGKVLEIHEGNDEATPETINMANKLVNPQGKLERIYGSHGIDVVRKIEETGYLPANLYVSNYKPHALSYMDLEGKRTTFTGIINTNSVNQESELDWKTIGPTKIYKFRYL